MIKPSALIKKLVTLVMWGFTIPYKAETNYTDAVTVAEADGKYYVEKMKKKSQSRSAKKLGREIMADTS